MGKVHLACGLLGISLLAACSQAPSTSHAAATLPPSSAPAVASPSTVPALPSPVATGAVIVGLWGVQADLRLVRTDGSIIATTPGVPVGDEHAIGAYLFAAADGSGKEWTIDRSGVIRDVAPAAAKLLRPGVGSPLVLSSNSAVIGCAQAANGDCTAETIDLVTGAVRPLLTLANTASEMRYGVALQVIDISADLKTVWFREISGATSTKLTLVAVDLATGNNTSHDLPLALADEQNLAISRDGKFVAGQESAGTDSTNLAIRHLHVFSLTTGVDTDIQGSAVYVGGWGAFSVLFAPDSSRVAWWGGVNNGSSPQRVNISLIGGTGKTVYPTDASSDVNGLIGVFWLDGSTLVTVHGGLVTVNADTGAAVPIGNNLDTLLGVLPPQA